MTLALGACSADAPGVSTGDARSAGDGGTVDAAPRADARTSDARAHADATSDARAVADADSTADGFARDARPPLGDAAVDGSPRDAAAQVDDRGRDVDVAGDANPRDGAVAPDQAVPIDARPIDAAAPVDARPDAAPALDAASVPDAAAAPDAALVLDAAAPPDAAPRPDAACVADCAGRACGDDGCGRSCGVCGPGQACAGGACACDPRLPAGWPARFAPSPRNPMVVPTSDHALQGADNVYAPDLYADAGGWLMWYGGQGADGHDRIFVATSRDGLEWRKWPDGADPQPVLDRGRSNHINDPSVIRVGDVWRMYYTDAPQAEDDVIALATARTATSFQREGFVLQPGPAGTWDSVKVGRPSVLHEGGVYRIWYDGTGPDGRRHVGLATSNDGVRFVRHAGNPVLRDAGAVDVKRVGDVYVMLREGGDGTRWATSVDGVCWVDRGLLFGRSGAPYDAHGQVTPFLWLVDGRPAGVWFGGASVAAWNRNRIAVALPEGVALGDAGCSACLAPGRSCDEVCADEGTCGAPGSADPGRCCACAPSGCEACLGRHDDCHVACVATGAAGGFCAHPGSADPGRCCTCLD